MLQLYFSPQSDLSNFSDSPPSASFLVPWSVTRLKQDLTSFSRSVLISKYFSFYISLSVESPFLLFVRAFIWPTVLTLFVSSALNTTSNSLIHVIFSFLIFVFLACFQCLFAVFIQIFSICQRSIWEVFQIILNAVDVSSTMPLAYPTRIWSTSVVWYQLGFYSSFVLLPAVFSRHRHASIYSGNLRVLIPGLSAPSMPSIVGLCLFYLHLCATIWSWSFLTLLPSIQTNALFP